MSTDTKCFVITDDWKKACQIVEKSLTTWVRGEIDREADKLGMNRVEYLHTAKGLCKFTNGCKVHCSTSFDIFYINFKVHAKNHTVFVFVEDHSYDLKDYTDQPVVRFIIGKWGLSDKIMEVITESLKELGDFWYNEDDNRAEDYVLIN